MIEAARIETLTFKHHMKMEAAITAVLSDVTFKMVKSDITAH
jgi:hypothetical protein